MTTKKIFTILLGIFLFFFLFFFLFLIGANKLFYSSIYLNALNENDAYSSLGEIANFPLDEFGFDNSQLELFVKKSVDNLTSYIRSENDELIVSFVLEKKEINEAIEMQFSGLNSCSSGENPIGENGFVCLPEGISVETLIDNYLKEIGAENGFHINLVEHLPMVEIDKFRGVYKTFNIVLYVLIFLILVLLFGLYLINHLNLKIAFRGIGYPLSIVGLVGILIYFLVPSILSNLLSGVIELSVIGNIVGSLVSTFIFGIFIWSLIFFIVGFGLIIGSFFVKKVL